MTDKLEWSSRNSCPAPQKARGFGLSIGLFTSHKNKGHVNLCS